MSKTAHSKNIKLLPTDIKMPKIPTAFVKNSPIDQVLCLTIDEFNFEEQSVIYLYCFINLSVSEITALTKLSTLHVVSILSLYSERLASKLRVFKKAVPYDTADTVSVKEMFELEIVRESGYTS